MTSPPTNLPTRAATRVLAKLFRGLADPSRLAILMLLRDGSRTVGELVAATGLTQSNVSNHLACLRECGLVQAERSGKFVTYCLCGTGVEELLQSADALLSRAWADIAACPQYGDDGAEHGSEQDTVE